MKAMWEYSSVLKHLTGIGSLCGLPHLHSIHTSAAQRALLRQVWVCKRRCST